MRFVDGSKKFEFDNLSGVDFPRRNSYSPILSWLATFAEGLGVGIYLYLLTVFQPRYAGWELTYGHISVCKYIVKHCNSA